jgi:hypothetical protein
MDVVAVFFCAGVLLGLVSGFRIVFRVYLQAQDMGRAKPIFKPRRLRETFALEVFCWATGATMSMVAAQFMPLAPAAAAGSDAVRAVCEAHAASCVAGFLSGPFPPGLRLIGGLPTWIAIVVIFAFTAAHMVVTVLVLGWGARRYRQPQDPPH